MITFADGRPNVAVPPRAAAVRAGPTSSLHQLRELAEQHARGDDIRWRVPPRRAGADLRTPKRRPVARIREPRRPAIAHSRPTAHHDPSSSAPRLRAAPVQLVAIGGRDGSEGRDDGGGSGDGEGGGGGSGDPPHRTELFQTLAATCDGRVA
jgi:hypothetical protein